MKLLRVGNKGKEKPAALDKGGNYIDLSTAIDDLNSDTLNFQTIEKIDKLDLSVLPKLENNSRIGACISKPSKFIGIGLNFSDHATEIGAKSPSEPIIFMKATSSINGPDDNIELVSNSKKLDWEVELGIVIGKLTKNINKNQSQDHILGYCLVNDVSERNFQKNKGLTWDKGKGFDTFGPIGPYIVTTDELPDFQKLNMFLDVNGKRMQTGKEE